MDCKFCKSVDVFKNGFVRGHQRYKCKACEKNFTDTPPRGVGEEKRLLALSLYASGLSMNRIAQFFGVSAVAVMKWIRALSEKLCPKIVPTEERALVMEVDEFWHYLKKRKQSCGSSKPMIVIESDLLTGNVGIIAPKLLNVSMSV